MSSEKNKLPFKIVEQKIPFLERVTLAIQVVVWGIAVSATTLVLLPVNFLRALFTSTRKVIEIDGHQIQGNIIPMGGGFQNPFSSPDDDEDWKREHKKEYGD